MKRQQISRLDLSMLAQIVPTIRPTNSDPKRLAYPFSPTSYWGKRMMSMRISKNDPGPVLY